MIAKTPHHAENTMRPFQIPGWVNWIAQDESGVWWGYSVEPLRNDHGWYENEVGEYIRLGVTMPEHWHDSLQRMPARPNI